jgi:glycerol-3-phosphate cytidylyltransferase
VEAGLKIGFTCSAFDLLHAGHVLMLKEARQHCEYLIVGLQTDPSLDRPEKNKPVQSLVERKIQLEGCRYVDEVVVYQTEKELEELLTVLPINVRFLGADYRDRDFTGRQVCEQRGIEIYYNSRDHGYSSSGLRKRIVEQAHT